MSRRQAGSPRGEEDGGRLEWHTARGVCGATTGVEGSCPPTEKRPEADVDWRSDALPMDTRWPCTTHR